MGRFLRRKRIARAPSRDSVWQVPARFNFTRDVVEAFAADHLRPALTFVDRDGVIDRRTFAEVAAEANRWAALLRARGLSPGDRLLVLVGKTPAWHSVLLGALKAGLVSVPCSDMLRARDLAFRVGHSGARLVVADRERAHELAMMNVAVDVVIVEDVVAELRAHSVVQPTHNTAAEDIAFILYTSGTTKDPKGATHTHGYTWAKRLQAAYWLDARPGDLVWCTAGTGWAKSIWNVLLGPWSRGAEIVIHEGGFDVDQRFDLLRRLGVTVLCQAPTEYRLMAKHPSLARFDLGGLRHAVSAGEPLNPEVIKAFHDAFGLTVYDGYGQTENTLLVANARGTAIKPGSMGLPTPGHEMAVIDDDGNEQPPHTEGDLALRGRPASLFLGYWNSPEETSSVFRGEWYVTGDRATRDEDGYLWFTGRADDVILSSAYRIGPFEVESALLEHPAVAESAVVGKPDADRGELVKAFVVLRAGVEPSDELAVELQDHVKAVTAPYKYPREIEFVAGLPKTASGKIRRVELRERERSFGAATRVHGEALAAERVAAEARDEADARAQAEALAATEARAVAEARAEAQRIEEIRRADEDSRAAAERASREAEQAAEVAAKAERQREDAERQRAEDAERQRAEDAERQRAEDAERRRAEDAERRRAEDAERRRAEDAGRRRAEDAERQRADQAAQEQSEQEARRLRDVEQQLERERQAAETLAREVAEREATRLAAARVEAPPTDRASRREAERRLEEEERQRKREEKRLQEEAKAAAEQARRDETEARRAAEAQAKVDERQRKEYEKRLREEAKAEAERSKLEAEERRRADGKAEESRRAAEAQQRQAEERLRNEAERQRKEDERKLADQAQAQRKEAERRQKEAARGGGIRKRVAPGKIEPAVPMEEDDHDDRPNAALISRLRAYGRREEIDPEGIEPPGVDPDSGSTESDLVEDRPAE